MTREQKRNIIQMLRTGFAGPAGAYILEPLAGIVATISGQPTILVETAGSTVNHVSISDDNAAYYSMRWEDSTQSLFIAQISGYPGGALVWDWSLSGMTLSPAEQAAIEALFTGSFGTTLGGNGITFDKEDINDIMYDAAEIPFTGIAYEFFMQVTYSSVSSVNNPVGTVPIFTTVPRYNGVTDLAIDAAGNVLVADLSNNALRLLDPATNVVSTIAGSLPPTPASGNVPGNTPGIVVGDDVRWTVFESATWAQAEPQVNSYHPIIAIDRTNKHYVRGVRTRNTFLAPEDEALNWDWEYLGVSAPAATLVMVSEDTEIGLLNGRSAFWVNSSAPLVIGLLYYDGANYVVQAFPVIAGAGAARQAWVSNVGAIHRVYFGTDNGSILEFVYNAGAYENPASWTQNRVKLNVVGQFIYGIIGNGDAMGKPILLSSQYGASKIIQSTYNGGVSGTAADWDEVDWLTNLDGYTTTLGFAAAPPLLYAASFSTSSIYSINLGTQAITLVSGIKSQAGFVDTKSY